MEKIIMKKLNKKGFTLVELVIVISVIAILSAVMVPTFSGVVRKAKVSTAIQEAKTAYTEYMSEFEFGDAEATLESDLVYEADNGKYVAIKAGAFVLNENGEVATFDSEDDVKALFIAEGADVDDYELAQVEDTVFFQVAEKE